MRECHSFNHTLSIHQFLRDINDLELLSQKLRRWIYPLGTFYSRNRANLITLWQVTMERFSIFAEDLDRYWILVDTYQVGIYILSRFSLDHKSISIESEQRQMKSSNSNCWSDDKTSGVGSVCIRKICENCWKRKSLKHHGVQKSLLWKMNQTSTLFWLIWIDPNQQP